MYFSFTFPYFSTLLTKSQIDGVKKKSGRLRGAALLEMRVPTRLLPGRLVEYDDVERCRFDDALGHIIAETRIEDTADRDDEQVLAAVLRPCSESEIQVRPTADGYPIDGRFVRFEVAVRGDPEI
jgi:hypothetical protein